MQFTMATLFKESKISVCIFIALLGFIPVSYSDDEVEFNTDILDLKDRGNIDLSQFSRGGYIMPGTYSMIIRVNNNELSEQSVTFYTSEDDAKKSVPCLTREIINQFGLKSDFLEQLTWDGKGNCVATDAIKGMEAKGDLGTSTLSLNIPQAYLEYTSDNWDPPALWEDGIPGVLFDYNVNAQTQHQNTKSSQIYDISGNGTVGTNIGAWRLRADWQGQYSHQKNQDGKAGKGVEWSRYYLYRALPTLRSKLIMGEDFLDSGIFDSFRFTGINVRSDDNMLPPNLRGYAPEVVGVAKSNAKVVIRQQGRVLYETQVAAGPFRIQDINDAVSGELDVRIEEQDGSVKQFKINTANIPYLTRPGRWRFNFAAGKPTDGAHNIQGPLFGTGEFSWGVNNGWSLYGGALAGSEYNAVSLGVGRDLMVLGALSFDVTQSRASIPNIGEEKGTSYRLSYSKNFDDYGSQVTFAGYRFSQESYMSMSEYLDARYYGNRSGGSKEMYTIRLSKQFSDLGLTAFADYNHQTYWDRPVNDRYNINVARYFDIGRFKNISLSLTLQRGKYNRQKDDSIFFGVSMPWGNNSSISYSSNVVNGDSTHQLGYFDRVDEHNTYSLNSGVSRYGTIASAYMTHEGNMAQFNANASFQSGQYSAIGISAQGGATLTSEGGALHRGGAMGGTRILLDTQGVEGVPVRGFGSTTDTNMFGKAIIADVSSYYRNKASIDLNALGDDAEANNSVVQATLTEGAIGYRKFDVIAGRKSMATIKLPDGSSPPFGAIVKNNRQQQTGIVNDNGSTYLSGIKPGDSMNVTWGADKQCQIKFPSPLPENMIMNSLLLPCLTAVH
ncbi:outer membrane usher protein [Citrobacter portucalensis]|uniref:Outer membrane usher protein n=1 Tax=Citrobacter portucalensis TaxID=1639133 RepID=A0AAW5WDD8_9ENTR|nr:outer membrane usher protein [Citrobacter portucalensis]MCX9004738.1 outer membrane usher protein [Citrobacter portucalensis]